MVLFSSILKNSYTCMLSCPSSYVPLVFIIVANNGIMVVPSLPHGSTKTILMRNYQSKNWGLIWNYHSPDKLVNTNTWIKMDTAPFSRIACADIAIIRTMIQIALRLIFNSLLFAH